MLQNKTLHHSAFRKRIPDAAMARNHSDMHGSGTLLALLFFFLISCTTISPEETALVPPPESDFNVELPKKTQEFASAEKIAQLSPEKKFQYRLGPGDQINIQVWKRPDLSQKNIVVSPDGLIAVPRIGSINVLNRTPQEIKQIITSKLENLYTRPEVTLRVEKHKNNKAFVLGRVSKPGVVNFPGRGTLLEALALAGGLPYHGKETFLTKCAIIRGKDTVIWIDLQELLQNGNMALNARIKNNDIIFIPEAEDELVYVMGEVITPGAIQLKRTMNVFKAIMLAGGISNHANTEKVFIIRQQNMKGDVIKVNLKNLLEHGDFSQNFALKPNDIVFVSPDGMTKFNYTIEKLIPPLRVLNLITDNAEAFGIMQEIRRELWGQEGFVNTSSD
ncbi:polysaccharide biosynthesis/export family protein [Prosthecochloris marina]|nr:polysaccharide biosynthesis/export family protein [Prosthecochloris marina]